MEEKTRHQISADELEFRQSLFEQLKINPSRKAMAMLEERIGKVLQRLGVDITKDAESITQQMDLLSIFINSVSEEESPKAAGIYISAMVNGNLVPYAYISSAVVKNGEYTFPIVYWGEEVLDEGTPDKIMH